jgi:serine/threonine protein kinase
VTRTGVILGTPGYMAPELAAGSKQASPAVDVFALGVVAYELLDLGYPFTAPPIVEAIYGRAPTRARSLGRENLTEALAALLDACLDADPANRPTALQVRDALLPV